MEQEPAARKGRAPTGASRAPTAAEVAVSGWGPALTARRDSGDCVLDCCRPIRAGELIREHQRAHVVAHDRCVPRSARAEVLRLRSSR